MVHEKQADEDRRGSLRTRTRLFGCELHFHGKRFPRNLRNLCCNQTRGYHDKQKVFKSNQFGPFSRWGSHLSEQRSEPQKPTHLAINFKPGIMEIFINPLDQRKQARSFCWEYFVNNLCCLNNVQQGVHAFTLHASFFGTQLTSISLWLTASPESHPQVIRGVLPWSSRMWRRSRYFMAFLPVLVVVWHWMHSLHLAWWFYRKRTWMACQCINRLCDFLWWFATFQF